MKNKIIKILIFLVCYNINIASAADKLGRLFTLPQERIQLDKWRFKKPTPPESVASIDMPQESKTQTLELPDIITFNGIILRQGRQPIIWLNGKKNEELQGVGVDIKTIKNMALPVFLQELTDEDNPKIVWSKEVIYLKPAQILDTKNRQVIETYKRESVLETLMQDTNTNDIESTTVIKKVHVPEKEEDSSFFEKFKSILDF